MNLQDEIDWNDLKRRPEKLFGYSYLYFLAVLAGLGMLYVGNLTTAGKNSIVPGVPADSSSIVQELPLQSPRVLPSVDVMKYGIPSPELVQRGKNVYNQNCSSCHGDNGDGNGPTASVLASKPRNFHSLEGWKNGSKVSQIYATLESGLRGTAMSSFNYMTPADRFAVIHFVRSLAPNQPADSREELKQLDARYELAKGVNVPGQIPVKRAVQLIGREAGRTFDTLQMRIERLKENEQRNILLSSVIENPQKIIVGFYHRPDRLNSPDIFLHSVASDPAQLGFKPAVLRLTAAEWKELYLDLRTITGRTL